MATSRFCLLLALCVATAIAGTKRCTIKRFGKLTLFNKETHSVEQPCKYRLADFNCDNYRAYVTPGSAIDGFFNNRFSPETLYVKLVDRQDDSQQYVARTSAALLRQALNGDISDPWEVISDTMAVDFAGLVNNTGKKAAKLQKGAIYVELFEKDSSGDDAGVSVRCTSDSFSSKGLDKSLCGDKETSDALTLYKEALLGSDSDLTWGQTLFYKVLDDSRITQSQSCSSLATTFQACGVKEDAARLCEAVLGQVSLAKCLASAGQSLDYYAELCLNFVCDGTTADRDTLRAAVNANCPELIDSVP